MRGERFGARPDPGRSSQPNPNPGRSDLGLGQEEGMALESQDKEITVQSSNVTLGESLPE